jgi:hypothetical protein
MVRRRFGMTDSKSEIGRILPCLPNFIDSSEPETSHQDFAKRLDEIEAKTDHTALKLEAFANKSLGLMPSGVPTSTLIEAEWPPALEESQMQVRQRLLIWAVRCSA